MQQVLKTIDFPGEDSSEFSSDEEFNKQLQLDQQTPRQRKDSELFIKNARPLDFNRGASEQ